MAWAEGIELPGTPLLRDTAESALIDVEGHNPMLLAERVQPHTFGPAVLAGRSKPIGLIMNCVT